MNFQYTPKVEMIQHMDANHGTKAGIQIKQDNSFSVEYTEHDNNTELRRFVNNWIEEIRKLNDKEYQETVVRTYAFVEDNLNDDMGSDAAYSNGLALLYKQCLDELVISQTVEYTLNEQLEESTKYIE